MTGAFGGMGLGAFAKDKSVVKLDSAAGDAAAALAETLPAVDERAILADVQNIRGLAMTVVLLLADAVVENTMGDDTIPSDYLDELMLEGIGGEDEDEVDPMVNQLLTAHIMDAFSSLGVSDDVISDIFGEEVEAADAAIEAAADTIIANLPNEGDDLDSFIDEFIYGFDAGDVLAEEEVEEFDAVGKKLSAGKKSTREVNGRKIRYQAVRAVRHGKVTVINKRLGGQKVRLSAKQKQGLKKARLKSSTFGSIKKRMRSLTKGVNRKIYKK